ncbi:MAG TPA: hypothetical protein VJ485_04015 [archaeon]|nr:hypothetical protein [archaeon]
MNAALKLLVGLIFIALGLGLLIDSVIPVLGNVGTSIGAYTINWFDNLIIVLTGVIPAFLIMLGLFVVWLEMDEMKAEKELKKEEEKAKKEEKPARKKK